VPLVMFGYGPDVDERAKAVGAVAGFRKPIDVGMFMTGVGWIPEKRAG
jgi:hypothetical protein